MSQEALNLSTLRRIEPWVREAQRSGRLDGGAAIEILAEIYALQLARVKAQAASQLSAGDAGAGDCATGSTVEGSPSAAADGLAQGATSVCSQQALLDGVREFAAEARLSDSAARQLSLLLAATEEEAGGASGSGGSGAADESQSGRPHGVAAPTQALASPGVHPGVIRSGEGGHDYGAPSSVIGAEGENVDLGATGSISAPAKSLREFLAQRNISVALAASGFVLAVVAGLLLRLWGDMEARAILLAAPAALVLAWGSTLRRWREPAGVIALAVVLLAVPVHVVAVGAWQVQPSVVAVELLLALVLAMLASRELRVPGAASGVLLVMLSATAFVMRPEVLGVLPRIRPVLEFFLLALFGAGTWSVAGGLYQRRLEQDWTMRVGSLVSMGAMLLAYVMVSFNLLLSHGHVLEANWIGPWIVGSAAPLVGAAVVLLMVPRSGGAGLAMRICAIIALCIAAAALVLGLMLSNASRQSMLVSLCLAFFLTALAGAYLEGRRARPFQALASLLLPIWAAFWASGREAAAFADLGVVSGTLGSTYGALGFGGGVTLIYLFGLWLNRPEQSWSRNIPLVSSISLAIPALLWLALVTGGPQILTVAGVAPFSPATLLMAAMALGGLATAWRVRWEPLVYLSSLALLCSIGVRAARITGAGMQDMFLRHLTINVTLLAVVLVLAGGLLATIRRRDARAAFYCEGLLVMGLAATALMSLLAGLTAWETGLHGHHVALLGALAVSLLVAALVFRQEDLFGFFGLALLLAGLAGFGVWGFDDFSGYLSRYGGVALVLGLILALISALMARRSGDDPLKRRFAWGLYVSALAGPAAALGLMWMTPNMAWRGLDLLLVAATLAVMRAHTLRGATNYAVIAAVTAAAFYLLAHNFTTTVRLLHDAAMIGAAAMGLGWLLVSLVVRRVLLAGNKVSDREARGRCRPFTVVGMAALTAVSGYLTLLTVLGYRAAIGFGASPVDVGGLPRFSAGAMMIAWGLVLSGMMASIWLFRHSLRTYAFYVAGSLAAISLGLLLTSDGELLLDYLIVALGAYGAAHLLVYLGEGQFMRLLSRYCALYREERHASTAIFSASCMSCFAAATLAAFFLYRPTALVMLGLLTLVFFTWSLLHRRAELLYPAVIISIQFLLSIWHVIEGPGGWTPERQAVNSLVFASGAVLWMTIGWRLNRLRGPWSLLNTPARQMSVIVALISLGFYIALTLSAAWHGGRWLAWNALTDLIVGLVIGATLTVYFAWVGRDFRRVFFIYLSYLSLASLVAFVVIRVGRSWEPLAEWWPVMVVGSSLVVLLFTRLLQRRRFVLFGRPLFYSATLFLPLAPLAGGIMAAYEDRFDLATPTFLMLGVLYLTAARIRDRTLLVRLATFALTAAVFSLWRWLGLGFERHPQFFLVPAGVALVILALVGRTHLRRETVQGVALLGLVVAFGGSLFEVVLMLDDASGFPYAYLFSMTTGMIGVTVGVWQRLRMVRNVSLSLLLVDLALGLAALTWWEGRAWLVLMCAGLVGGSLVAIGLLSRGQGDKPAGRAASGADFGASGDAVAAAAKSEVSEEGQ